MPGDDDDIIIHRTQHQSTTDTMTPLDLSRARYAAVLALLPGVITDSQVAADAAAMKAMGQ